MKKIYDISLPISESLPVWPGDPLPVIERFSKMEEGEAANVSRMELCVHFGTHVDAPCHFVEDGRTVDKLPLDALLGLAQVCEIPQDCNLITANVLKDAGIAEGVRRVLFKTRNSQHWVNGDTAFDQNFVALSENGAQYLVETGMLLVGIDYLSIAPFSEPVPTHKVLLEKGVIVVESIDLSAVPAGLYELVCLPLRIRGAEGAPARVLLISQ